MRSISKGKTGLGRNTLDRQMVGHLRRREAQKYGVVSFYELGNEWEDYSNYFGEGAEISRNWATAHFLAFYGRPGDSHGAGGCVT